MSESAFNWDIKHYPDLGAYLRALLPFHKPAWINSICLHHTWRPTLAQWRGYHSMQALGFYYHKLGWSAGPHLFLAADTPGPFTDGIWSGTPLAVTGVHAGVCNLHSIGIEVVGNYDAEPWPPHVSALVYGVTVALMKWGHIPPDRVRGHRECHSPKTCPGKMVDMAHVRAELRRRLEAP